MGLILTLRCMGITSPPCAASRDVVHNSNRGQTQTLSLTLTRTWSLTLTRTWSMTLTRTWSQTRMWSQTQTLSLTLGQNGSPICGPGAQRRDSCADA